MIPMREDVLAPFDVADWTPNRAQAKFLALWHSHAHSCVSAMMGWGTGKTRLIVYLIQSTWESCPNDDGVVITDSLSRGARTIGIEARLLESIGWRYCNTYRGIPAPHYLSPAHHGGRSRVWIQSWKRPSTKVKSANSIEGVDAGYALLDEANQMTDPDGEVASAMWGRVRSGTVPRVGLLGKPTFSPWWRTWAERQKTGIFFTAASHCNQENIPDFSSWVSTMSRREYMENILAQPMPPEGSIYNDWSPDTYPNGNVLPAGWKPEPWMTIHCTWDFGVRHPAALLIAHDTRLNGGKGADVVFGEAMPDGGASVFDVCRMLRRGIDGVSPGVWPAHRVHDMPEGSIPLTSVFGDRAGRNRRDDAAMSSACGDVEQLPQAGGLGLRVNVTDDPEKVHVLGGIKLVSRMILNNAGERNLLCTQELWNHGSQKQGRSFARSINEYRWQSDIKEIPNKTNGADHGADALRYWAVNARWPSRSGLAEGRAAFSSISTPARASKPVGSDR